MSFDLRAVIGTVAPTLATMLGGPLAGAAVSAIAGAFGLPSGSGQDDITKVVQSGAMTPEIIAKVRQADQEHAEKLRQMDIDLEKLNQGHQEALAATDASDRDSARKREIAVKDWTPTMLALGITAGFFGILGFLLFQAPPANSRDVLNIMLGSLGTAWVSMVAYYFGSSAGSEAKTKIIAGMTGK
jgi:hypothetical protein